MPKPPLSVPKPRHPASCRGSRACWKVPWTLSAHCSTCPSNATTPQCSSRNRLSACVWQSISTESSTHCSRKRMFWAWMTPTPSFGTSSTEATRPSSMRRWASVSKVSFWTSSRTLLPYSGRISCRCCAKATLLDVPILSWEMSSRAYTAGEVPTGTSWPAALPNSSHFRQSSRLTPTGAAAAP